MSGSGDTAADHRYVAYVNSPRPQSLDTSPAAERLQFEIWARMTSMEKFAAFLELQETAIALCEAGIRARHPHASDREVFLRRVARTLDEETMRKCYGWSPGADDCHPNADS